MTKKEMDNYLVHYLIFGEDKMFEYWPSDGMSAVRKSNDDRQKEHATRSWKDKLPEQKGIKRKRQFWNSARSV